MRKQKGFFLFELVVSLVAGGIILTLLTQQYIKYSHSKSLENQVSRFVVLGDLVQRASLDGAMPHDLNDMIKRGYDLGCHVGSKNCQPINKTSWGKVITLGSDNDWKTYFVNVPLQGLSKGSQQQVIFYAKQQMPYVTVADNNLKISFVIPYLVKK